jgi:predicted nucleic acid-binding protein
VGILIDSTVFIAAERRGLTARQCLAEIERQFPGEDAGISVITLTELAHGAARADTPARKAARQLFIRDLMAAIPMQSVTPAVALLAGEMDGANKAKGIHLELSDLLIGVTALDAGYEVVTSNLRHFRLIAGLRVRSI